MQQPTAKPASGRVAAVMLLALTAMVPAPTVSLAQGMSSSGARSWDTRQPTPRPRGFFNFLFGNPAGPQYTEPDYEEDYGFPAASYATYKTLCVRLCDGYYWPISNATTRHHFAYDSQRCEASCEAPAKLFIHRNPGGEVEHMTDLAGRPYADLPRAFLYRKEYVAGCRCKPDPWTAEAQADYAARGTNAVVPLDGAVSQQLEQDPSALAEAESERQTVPSRYWSATRGHPPRYDSARQQRRPAWRFPFFSFR